MFLYSFEGMQVLGCHPEELWTSGFTGIWQMGSKYCEWVCLIVTRLSSIRAENWLDEIMRVKAFQIVHISWRWKFLQKDFCPQSRGHLVLTSWWRRDKDARTMCDLVEVPKSEWCFSKSNVTIELSSYENFHGLVMKWLLISLFRALHLAGGLNSFNYVQ